MNKRIINIRNIKSQLSQKIREVYQNQLDRQLDRVSYKLFDNTLVITIEGTVTSPEKLLKDNNYLCLAKEVRNTIDEIVKPQIQEIIEEVLEVKVIDFLSDTTIDNDLTGAIAIFEVIPKNTSD